MRRFFALTAVACAWLVGCGSDVSSSPNTTPLDAANDKGSADVVPGDSPADTKDGAAADASDVQVPSDATDVSVDTADAAEAAEAQAEAADGSEAADVIVDAPKDTPIEAPTPTCLSPQLPQSCLLYALACTGLATCGPTVTGCFQYGSEDFPNATWLISDDFTAFSLGAATYTAAFDTLRVDYSSGAWMLTEFAPRPRALYFSPANQLCAMLDFHYDENSDNWGDYDVARNYYLRYGNNKVVVLRPRFELSPAVWWRIEGYDIECADGSKETWTFDAFEPFQYLLFGGESHNGKSFLPYWTADKCELAQFDKDCMHSTDIVEESSCNGSALHLCKRGVSLNVDCATHGKSCVQVPVGYGGEIYYYHSFCFGGDLCTGDDYCVGDTLGDCWGSVAELKDCGALGATCVLPAFGASPAVAMCVQKPATPCDSNTFQASCAGDTAVRCEYYGYEFRQDCARLGMTCALGKDYESKPYPFCVPAGSTQPCDSSFQQACQGDVKKSCLGEAAVVAEDCKARWNKVCKVGTTGAACVDQMSTPCDSSPSDALGCSGDRVMACGAGGLSVFDDCTKQGLELTAGAGRTCLVGGQGYGACGQKGAATCDYGSFTPVCNGTLIVNCIADHQVQRDCLETGFSTLVPGWCNTDGYGTAYCESMSVAQCDPATTPSTCEASPPVAINCTSSKVLIKTDCTAAGLPECKINQAQVAVCAQAGSIACDAGTYVEHCDQGATVVCSQGFSFATSCPSGYECGVNASSKAVCHQTGSAPCDEYFFNYHCDGEVAVSCQDGFERHTDCPSVCPGCTCHSQTMQAWCQP